MSKLLKPSARIQASTSKICVKMTVGAGIEDLRCGLKASTHGNGVLSCNDMTLSPDGWLVYRSCGCCESSVVVDFGEELTFAVGLDLGCSYCHVSESSLSRNFVSWSTSENPSHIGISRLVCE